MSKPSAESKSLAKQWLENEELCGYSENSTREDRLAELIDTACKSAVRRALDEALNSGDGSYKP